MAHPPFPPFFKGGLSLPPPLQGGKCNSTPCTRGGTGGFLLHTLAPPQHRSAFTLLELLLVLALMVAAVAAALPSLKTSFSNQRLQKAAEQIRAEWTRARARAIKTGQTQIFRHTLYSRRFLTTPLVSWEDDVEASPLLNPSALGREAGTSRDFLNRGTLPQNRTTPNPLRSGLPNSQTSMPDQPSLESWGIRWRELPQEVVFLGADVQLDQRTLSQLSTLPEEPVPDFEVDPRERDRLQGTTETTWGTPVFFFPDGTTSTVRLLLANEQQRTIEVWLRGLTGTTRVGPIQSVATYASPEGALP